MTSENPVERAANPSHGMPVAVEIGLRAKGSNTGRRPHAPNTAHRQLTS